MIQTDKTAATSVKAIREREEAEKAAKLRQQCEALATERYGAEQVVKWSNANKGLFYLPILDAEENIEKLAIMRPITRQILSYASTKIQDDGLYAFLEAAMRECFIEGDEEIIEDDEYFIPAANQFNKIIEGKKANLLKR